MGKKIQKPDPLKHLLETGERVKRPVPIKNPNQLHKIKNEDWILDHRKKPIYIKGLYPESIIKRNEDQRVREDKVIENKDIEREELRKERRIKKQRIKENDIKMIGLIINDNPKDLCYLKPSGDIHDVVKMILLRMESIAKNDRNTIRIKKIDRQLSDYVDNTFINHLIKYTKHIQEIQPTLQSLYQIPRVYDHIDILKEYIVMNIKNEGNYDFILHSIDQSISNTIYDVQQALDKIKHIERYKSLDGVYIEYTLSQFNSAAASLIRNTLSPNYDEEHINAEDYKGKNIGVTNIIKNIIDNSN